MSLYATTTTAATTATVTSNNAHESHAVDWTDTVDDYYKTTIAAAAVPRHARGCVWVGECDAAVTGRDNYKLLLLAFFRRVVCVAVGPGESERENDNESDQQVRGDGHRVKTKNAFRQQLTYVLLCIKSYYYYYHLRLFYSSPSKGCPHCFPTIFSYNIIQNDQGGRRAREKLHHPTYWRTTVVNINAAADAELKQKKNINTYNTIIIIAIGLLKLTLPTVYIYYINIYILLITIFQTFFVGRWGYSSIIKYIHFIRSINIT